MYEVEYKVEITEDEKQKLIALFQSKNFTDNGIVKQNDYYVEVVDSPLTGYDFKRYRDENGKYLCTIKTFEEVNGKMARREEEKEVSKNEFLDAIIKYPNATTIKKDRRSFLGNYKGNEIHIDIDSVKFDHSQSVRYFIEAELMTEDVKKVSTLRDEMIEFLKISLGRSELIEAPGMFTMAYKKL